MVTRVLLIDDDPIEHKLFETYLLRTFEREHTLVSSNALEAGLEELCGRSFDAVFIDNRLAPYGDYRQTLPTLMSFISSQSVYLISACTTGLEEVCKEFPIAGVLSKFEVKDAIEGGLLGRRRRNQTSATRPPVMGVGTPVVVG